MSELSVKHLLGIKYLKEADIQLIFDTATQFKEVINRPIKKVPSLRDITIANLFFENSTRTKLSFELAQKRLSADVINFASSMSSLKKGETLIDTVNNILSMKVDMVVMRHSSPRQTNLWRSLQYLTMLLSVSYLPTILLLLLELHLQLLQWMSTTALLGETCCLEHSIFVLNMFAHPCRRSKICWVFVHLTILVISCYKIGKFIFINLANAMCSIL